MRASFEGALSVGIHEPSNAVIVSAQEEWMPTIADMIEFLDKSALPRTSVSVVKLSPHISATSLRDALANVVGEAWNGDQRPGTQKKEKQGPQPPKPHTQAPERDKPSNE